MARSLKKGPFADKSLLNKVDAMNEAGDTLSIAAKSIAEIITIRGTINLDFNDVKTVLKKKQIRLSIGLKEA